MNAGGPLLAIEDLCIDFGTGSGGARRVVDRVSVAVHPNQVVALVGESGSGKTLTGRAVLRLLPPAARIVQGDIRFEGVSLGSKNEHELRKLRGRRIGMVFQEPMVSLNPALRIGAQMSEALILHERLSRSAARARCIEMLEKVQIADPVTALDAHPHQFSGGMRQRIMLASALLLRPALLIADEPTTALDALICKEVMDLMLGLARETGTAVLLISHDIPLVAKYADSAVVLKGGRVIDHGTVREVLLEPRHPETQSLMGALPGRRSDLAPDIRREPHIECTDLCVELQRPGFSLRRLPATRAVVHASFSIDRAETLALVGESGSGKTTIARTLLRLCNASGGSIRFDQHDVGALTGRPLAEFRTRTQMVFQDPYSSLDPRMRLGQIVAEGLRHVNGLSRIERLQRAQHVLEEVGLEQAYMRRFPHELSGGQRQRVCIARSVVANPRFIVADEPVSALDVTIRRQVLQLLASLKAKYGFTCLLISHDLAVVEEMADRVAVIYRGRLLEIGPRDAVYDTPRHPYTQRLLQATPRIATRSAGSYELVSTVIGPAIPPQGYEFYNHGSIPGAGQSAGEPCMLEVAPRHLVCCARMPGKVIPS